MTEDQKKTGIPFKNCCQGMPIREVMSKMIEKKSEPPFDWAEMMSRMAQMCCGSRKKKEGPAENPKEKEKI